MNYIRLLIGASLAFVVTGALFLLMPTLIEMSDKVLDDRKSRRITDITMPERQIEANVREVKPDKPKDPEEPPPEMEQQQLDTNISPEAINITPQAQMDISIDGGRGLGSDGEFMPIVKVAPIYPRRANSRGVEGYCTVEYTVTSNGSVKDPVAVDCSPAGFFEKSSVKAALKFKYKPRVVDGEAIDVVGVQNRFTFVLEK